MSSKDSKWKVVFQHNGRHYEATVVACDRNAAIEKAAKFLGISKNTKVLEARKLSPP